MNEILDLHGKPLKVGDNVIFTAYKDERMWTGKIISITLKRVLCQSDKYDYWNARIRHNECKTRVIKLNP